MKFFIYLSLVILILAPFVSVDCRRNASKSKKNKNKHQGVVHRVPKLTSSSSKGVNVISRPYSKPVHSFSSPRPVSTVFSSSPVLSSTPKGPRPGIVRAGFVARPYFAVRRYAVLRLRLTECPDEFLSNILVITRENHCPEVCTRSYCVQVQELCCIYKTGLVDEIEAL